MCNPGVSLQKTDKQLADRARTHLGILRTIVVELSRRGYKVDIRTGAGYLAAWPESLIIKKEVSL